MDTECHPSVGWKRRWTRRLLILLVSLIAMAVGALEYLARRTSIESTASGTSVIEPRGFFAPSNVAGFLRVGYTQWVDADNRKECFSVGDGCSLTANDPDRDGEVDEIYVLLKNDSILPYLRGYDRDLGGLRLFVHVDSNGSPQADEESLAELTRVAQALFDDGMRRYAGTFGR